jgi:sugar phosphate isomerase/epimerase
MQLKLACADFSFPLLEHDRALDLIAMLGFDGVDVGLFEGRSHLWPSRVFKRGQQAAGELHAKLKDRGLQAADIYLQTAADFVSLAPNHPDPKKRRKARDLLLHALDFACGCDSRHVSALPGVHFPDEPRACSLSRARDELAWRCGQAESRGLVFSIEAHVGSIVPRPKQALELVAKTPGLTLTLDYTHFTKLGMADAEIEPLVAHASHFHARGACQGRLQASMKDNVIDYTRVLRAMREQDYRGYIGIEYVWIDWEHCNEVDNLSETILLRDFFRGQKRTRSQNTSPKRKRGD